MLNPSACEDHIVEFVKEKVLNAGGKPCPSFVIRVGLGGTFDYCAYFSKKALLRKVGQYSDQYKLLEKKS